jgi:hypothetical protein
MSNIINFLNKLTKGILPLVLGFVLAFSLIAVPASAQVTNLTPGQDILCRDDCPALSDPEKAVGNATERELASFVVNVARFVTFIGVALAILLLVYGGILYVTDSGDGKRAEAGKTVVLNAVIGLVVIVVAYTIVAVVVGFLNGDLLGYLFGNGTRGTTA